MHNLAQNPEVFLPQHRGHRPKADDADCRSYGATFGSPAYVRCRTDKSDTREQSRAALSSALLSRHRYCYGVGGGYGFSMNCF
jgi:hypothetical protein